MNNKKMAGFSLVELMIVVLIIGVLAAVAFPQYRSFQAKSQQQEAISLLSTYFAASQASLSELRAYPGNFVAIGFAPTGEVHYRITAKDNTTAVPTGAPNEDACISTSASCNTWSTTFKTWTEVSSGRWYVTAPTTAATISDSAFKTVASAVLITTRTDEWTIDQGKILANPKSGL